MQTKYNNRGQIIAALEQHRDDAKIASSMRYFKTGDGQYGANDTFWGIKNPVVRAIVADIDPLIDIAELIALMRHEVHEMRLLAVIAIAKCYGRCFKGGKIADAVREARIRSEYLANLHYANNWDMVDLSAPDILGKWLILGGESTDEKTAVFDTLASSECLWRQRASVVSCLTPVRCGDITLAMRYAAMLIDHKHDLMRKALGWLLREVGKKEPAILRQFLIDYGARMSRTTLRYAIEKMDEEERRQWLKKQFS